MVLPSHSKGYSQGFLLDSFEWWWPCCWWWCVMMTTVGPGCYDDKAVTVLRTIIIVYYSSRNTTTMSTTKAALVVNCSLKALQNRSARLWDDTFLFAFCLPALSNLMKIPCMQPPFPLGASQKPSSQLALFCHGLGNQLESPLSPLWGFLSRVLSTSSSTSTPSNHHPFKRVGMRHAYPKSPDLTSLVADWTMYIYINIAIYGGCAK